MNVRDRVLFHSTLRRSRRDAALDHDVALDFCHAKASLMRKAYRAVIVAFTKRRTYALTVRGLINHSFPRNMHTIGDYGADDVRALASKGGHPSAETFRNPAEHPVVRLV